MGLASPERQGGGAKDAASHVGDRLTDLYYTMISMNQDLYAALYDPSPCSSPLAGLNCSTGALLAAVRKAPAYASGELELLL